MHLQVAAFAWAWLASCATAFIVPEELVSFLSIVYSNIPPIKKGTDSRVGVGFRLGPHADAQIVLELGPQTNTQPLGPNANAIPDTRKRHTSNPLIAKGQAPSGPAAGGGGGGDWLSAWRNSVAHRKPSSGGDHADPTAPDPTKLSGEPLVVHLRRLYHRIPDAKDSAAPSLLSASTSAPSIVTPSSPPTSPTPPTHIFKPFKRKSGSKTSVNKVTTPKPGPPPENLGDVTLND